jgi:hypothetical protein
LLFAVATLLSVGCVGWAVLSWLTATTYPTLSFYALFTKGVAPAAALALALTNLVLMVAARGAGATPRGTFLLRDLVQALSALYACIVLVAGSVWIAFQSASAASWYVVWLAFWPVLSLGVAHILGSDEPRKSVLDLWRARDKELERPNLPCELHALRMAGDEATLAIVASQLVRAVTASPRKVIDWISSWPRPLAVSIGVAMLLSGIVIGYVQAGEVAYGWRQVLMGAVLGAAEILVLLALAELLLSAVLLLLATLSYGLVGLAVGTDVFALLPAVRVGCESLPRGASEQMKLTLLWPDPEQRKQLKLRHSMYDLPSVQARVADWVRQMHRGI